MFKICPKCHYERKATDTGDPALCPACGLVFEKWMKRQLAATTAPADDESDSDISLLRQIIDMFLHVESRTEPVFFYGRLVLYAGFLFWGWHFIMLDLSMTPDEIGKSFMHNINLVFHEAGHVIFRPFGWFMTILGGSLFQVLMPLIVMLSFVFKNHDNFAASIALWWMGQSFMDVAPYIDDALDQQMLLLGGVTGADRPGYHDWNNILGEFNRLEKCHDYAALADNTGAVLMIIAFVWGGYILYQQFENMRLGTPE